jgi:hypothetical protein
MPTGTGATTESQTGEPHHEEDGCEDPQEVHRETHSDQQEHDEKHE